MAFALFLNKTDLELLARHLTDNALKVSHADRRLISSLWVSGLQDWKKGKKAPKNKADNDEDCSELVVQGKHGKDDLSLAAFRELLLRIAEENPEASYLYNLYYDTAGDSSAAEPWPPE